MHTDAYTFMHAALAEEQGSTLKGAILQIFFVFKN